MAKTPAPSASLLVAGFIASALGGVLNVVGVSLNAAEVASKYSTAAAPGTGWVVIGCMIALGGLIALGLGLYNLASGVDYLVREAAAEAPAATPMDAPTETA
jgi:hypothetical protein